MKYFNNNFIKFSFLLMLIYNNSFSQNNDYASVDKLQGNWMLYDEKGINDLILVRGNTFLSISKTKRSNGAFIGTKTYSIFGFSDYTNVHFKVIKELSTSGMYQICFDNIKLDFDSNGVLLQDGIILNMRYNANQDFYKDSTRGRDYFYTIANNSQRSVYYRKDTIPKFLIESLKGTKDWVKYLNFKKMFEKKIIVKKSTIYSAINNPSKDFFNLNDEIEVLEIYEAWSKVKGIKTEKIAWIKNIDYEKIPELEIFKLKN